VSSSASIRAGLAVSPRVTKPHAIYKPVLLVFERTKNAHLLLSRPQLDAHIVRTLEVLRAGAVDEAEREALDYAYENSSAFTAWVRRKPGRIESILADARVPAGTVTP
jgi:hypothetical protein